MELVPVLARWLHFLAGIMWIGLLYYFNFVQVPALKAAAADNTAPGITRHVAPRAEQGERGHDVQFRGVIWSAAASAAAFKAVADATALQSDPFGVHRDGRMVKRPIPVGR